MKNIETKWTRSGKKKTAHHDRVYKSLQIAPVTLEIAYNLLRHSNVDSCGRLVRYGDGSCRRGNVLSMAETGAILRAFGIETRARSNKEMRNKIMNYFLRQSTAIRWMLVNFAINKAVNRIHGTTSLETAINNPQILTIARGLGIILSVKYGYRTKITRGSFYINKEWVHIG